MRAKKNPEIYGVLVVAVFVLYFYFLWAFVELWLLPTNAQTLPCAEKIHGDADCIPDATGKSVTIVDFQIWRNEFFNQCSTATPAGCGTDEDGDGKAMDADFDSDTFVKISDFEIWRKGYFAPAPTIVPPTPTAIPPTPTGTTSCIYPADVLNLTNWKITLPIGSGGSPTEIKPPAIKTYKIDPWFIPLPDCSGVQFRAHTSSSTTTSGSSYPRSELRERVADGSVDISWSNSSGTHTMIIDEAITAVPKGKRHVVAGQIHDSSDDVTVFRLELPNGTGNVGTLYVTDGNNTHATVAEQNYTLGDRFQVKFVATPGKIQMYYKKQGAANFTLVHTLNKTISGSYFKAGAYTQSNCTRETEYGSTCADDNYGEVILYDVTATHTP